MAYDGSVRSSEGFVLQPRYGEDNIDPAKSDHGKAVNVDKVITNILTKRGR